MSFKDLKEAWQARGQFAEANEKLGEKTTLQEKIWDLQDKIDDLWFELCPWHWLYRLPHNIFHDWPIEVKWAWQRVFTGYDERVVWGPYDYLGKIILTHLKNFRNYNKHGYPIAILEDGDSEDQKMNENRWNKILDDMIDGWEFLVDDDKFNDEIVEKYGDERNSEDTFMGVKLDNKKWNKKCTEEYEKLWEEKQKKAQLFVQYFRSLWD